MWSSRDLKPICKNIIVKSYDISQLVFQFLVLPNPPPHFIKELNGTILNFIWASNPGKKIRMKKLEKIQNTVISPYHLGGLNIIHIDSFIAGLKCT